MATIPEVNRASPEGGRGKTFPEFFFCFVVLARIELDTTSKPVISKRNGVTTAIRGGLDGFGGLNQVVAVLGDGVSSARSSEMPGVVREGERALLEDSPRCKHAHYSICTHVATQTLWEMVSQLPEMCVRLQVAVSTMVG